MKTRGIPFTEMGYLTELEEDDFVELDDLRYNEDWEMFEIAERHILRTFVVRAPFMTKTGLAVVSTKIMERCGR